MEDTLEQIREAERMIEDAAWKSVEDEDYQTELESYRTAKGLLDSVGEFPPAAQKEHDRVMAYCLMRINDVKTKMGENSDYGLVHKSLGLAEKSGDIVQIARSSLAVGIHILNKGNVPEAETYFRRIIESGAEHKDNRDFQQVVGWAFMVRTNILLGKSLYNQALYLAQEAVSVLKSVENYAGLHRAYRLLARVHQALGQGEEADSCLKISERYEDLAKTHHQ